MSDFFKVLFNLRILRAQVRDIPLEQLKDGLSKLTEVIKERENQEEILLREQEEKKRKIEEIKKLLESDGLSLSDLASINEYSVSSTQKEKKPVEPKYQFNNEKGELCTWSGRGIKPKSISEAIKNGASLDDFLIQK